MDLRGLQPCSQLLSDVLLHVVYALVRVLDLEPLDLRLGLCQLLPDLCQLLFQPFKLSLLVSHLRLVLLQLCSHLLALVLQLLVLLLQGFELGL